MYKTCLEHYVVPKGKTTLVGGMSKENKKVLNGQCWIWESCMIPLHQQHCSEDKICTPKLICTNTVIWLNWWGRREISHREHPLSRMWNINSTTYSGILTTYSLSSVSYLTVTSFQEDGMWEDIAEINSVETWQILPQLSDPGQH